jgi:hypothetical protein
MERIQLIVLNEKLEGLERLFAAGFDSEFIRAEALAMLKTPDIPVEEKARLEILAQAGLGNEAARSS